MHIYSANYREARARDEIHPYDPWKKHELSEDLHYMSLIFISKKKLDRFHDCEPSLPALSVIAMGCGKGEIYLRTEEVFSIL